MVTISFFADFFSKIPAESTIAEIVRLIKTSQKLKSITESYRITGDKRIKATSPTFGVACTFQNGKGKENVKALTALCLVDLDHIGSDEQGGKGDESSAMLLQRVKQQAIGDPHTLLCYTTISGKGLRIIFQYQLDAAFSLAQQMQYYAKVFVAGNAYYAKLLGVEADEQCKNVTRLSGLAYDPDVYYQPDAAPFPREWIEQTARKNLQQKRSLLKREREMKRIQTKYDSVIKPEVEREGGRYEPSQHNDYVMRVGYKLNQFGFSQQNATAWAVKNFPEYDGVEQVMRSCYTKTDEFASRGGSKPAVRKTSGASDTASVGDIEQFLSQHIQLRYNVVTKRTEYRHLPSDGKEDSWKLLIDHHVNSLWKKMAATQRVLYADLLRVIDSDFVKDFNPFQAYLDSLPQWKEGDTDYLQQLADTIRVRGDAKEQMLWATCLKKWFVAMVAAWLRPGVVNNVILVLIGEQGAYKTTWVNYLLPEPLRQYFYTKTNANRMSKDDLLTLALYALVCCEELDTMRPSELNQLKAMVTMPTINERAAYAHYHEMREHIASFAATGNNAQFLSDTTGNRRWLPFEVLHIDSPREHPFPYEGMYAQALYLLRHGFQFWFSKGEIQQVNSHNRYFEAPRLEEELVDLYYRKPRENELGVFVSVARAIQVMGACLAQKLSSVAVSRAFRNLGFKAARTPHSRGFIAMPRSAEEIKAYQLTQRQESVAEETDKPLDDGLPF